jgi:hypothetical protein
MSDVFIAVLRCIGATVVSKTLWVCWRLLLIRRSDRLIKWNTSLKVEYGIDLDRLKSGSNAQKDFLKAIYAEFSNKHLNNRISDFFGKLFSWFAILTGIISLVYLLVIAYGSIANDISIDIYAWWVIAISIPYCIIGYLISPIPFMLTGRHAGQAATARAIVARLECTYDLKTRQ